MNKELSKGLSDKINAINNILETLSASGILSIKDFILYNKKVCNLMEEALIETDEEMAFKKIEPSLIALANYIKAREWGLHPDYFSATEKQRKIARSIYDVEKEEVCNPYDFMEAADD